LFVFLLLRLFARESLWWVAFLADFTPWYFALLLFLFPLALLTRIKRNTLLMLPLVLVGILWFGPYFVPKADMEAD
jgi:hypothetical protein